MAGRDNAVTIIGTGAGLNVKGIDQFQYRYLTRPAGDFQVIARLVSFDGLGSASAGIMVRGNNTNNCPMTALYYKSNGNTVGWLSRTPGDTLQDAPHNFASGIRLAQPLPLWLKMVRTGKNFAVYKSRDGKIWSMISNVSGGPIALNGPLELGFYVTSDSDGKPVSATFDSIEIGAARMPYETSWIGNTFGAENNDGHVSNTLSALWVAPDGTCYASSYWDEGGHPVTSYPGQEVCTRASCWHT